MQQHLTELFEKFFKYLTEKQELDEDELQKLAQYCKQNPQNLTAAFLDQKQIREPTKIQLEEANALTELLTPLNYQKSPTIEVKLNDLKKESQLEKRYKVLETLGEGGMGIVQKVQDSLLGREVALKRIKGKDIRTLSIQQQTLLWRLNREAFITAELEHPNIIPLYDMQQGNNELYFTMRKVDGKTLKEILVENQKDKNYDENRLLTIFLKICDAIAYAHSKGVVHRDLKPDNIMVGEFGEVYVMDWGIAKKLSSSDKEKETSSERAADKTAKISLENEDTKTASVHAEEEIDTFQVFTTQFQLEEEHYKTIGGLGTPGYMPPEQIVNANQVRIQADIFSLGKILQECFTGTSPLDEIRKSRKEEHITLIELLEFQTTQLSRNIPLGVQTVIEKATRKEWEKRYENVRQLTSELILYQKNLQSSLREYLNFLLDIDLKCNTPEVAIPFLIDSLSDQNKYIRQDAAWTLGKLSSELQVDVVPLLKESLGNSSSKTRMEAAWLIGKLGKEANEALPELLKSLEDPHKYVQRMAAWALYKNPEANEHTVPILEQSLLHDENQHNRMVAAAALGEIGNKAKKAIPSLKQALNDEDYFVQVGSAFAMSQIDPEDSAEAIPFLLQGMTSENVHVKMKAAKALGDLRKETDDIIVALEKGTIDENTLVAQYSKESLEKIKG